MHIYTLQVLNFNCLSQLYLHCSCIFSLQPNISIASLYFYCMHYRYVLQTHICIASAYFHCKWIFLLLAHIFIAFAYFCCNLVEIVPTLCEKFLTLLEKFLTVWRYVKPGKQNKVIVKTRLLAIFFLPFVFILSSCRSRACIFSRWLIQILAGM